MAREDGKKGKPQPGSPPKGGETASAHVPGPADEYIATILAREAYSRERAFFLARVLTAVAATLALSVCVNAYLATRPIEVRYVATDPSGRIKELATLDKPIAKQAEVMAWLTEAVTRAYTFSFANYRQELAVAKESFTPAGWRGFEKSLQASGNLDSVIQNKYVSTAVPNAAPVLQVEGLIEGRYAWKVQTPVLVTYQGQSNKITQNLTVTAVVVRVPETEQASGLAIASLIAE